MALLGEIKKFLGKFIHNPIKSIVVAYLIYKILKSNNIKEALVMQEDFTTWEDDATKQVLLHDDATGSWIVLLGSKILHAGTDEQEARKVFQGDNKMENKKLTRLHEKVCKEAVVTLKFTDPETTQDAAEILKTAHIKHLSQPKKNVILFNDNEAKKAAKMVLKQKGMNGLERQSFAVESLHEKVYKEANFVGLLDEEYIKLAKRDKTGEFAKSPQAQDIRILSLNGGKVASDLAWKARETGWDKTRAAQNPEVLKLDKYNTISYLTSSDYWMGSPAASNPVNFKSQKVLNRMFPLNVIGQDDKRWLTKNYKKFPDDVRKRIDYALSSAQSPSSIEFKKKLGIGESFTKLERLHERVCKEDAKKRWVSRGQNKDKIVKSVTKL